MSEQEWRDAAWQSCTRRIVAAIEEYSQDWNHEGPSKVTAHAIIRMIRSMPTPAGKETTA